MVGNCAVSALVDRQGDVVWFCGRKDEARACFEAQLACRNHVGLLSEGMDRQNGAMQLSAPWDTAV